MRVLGVLMLVMLLQGCSANYVRVNNGDVGNVNRLGVISLLGNVMNVRFQGIIVYGNKLMEVDVQDWKLDEYIYREVKGLVESNGTHEVVVVGINAKPVDFEKGYTEGGDFSEDRMIDELFDISQAYNLDAILIIVPPHRIDVPYGWYADGYGIFKHQGIAPTDTITQLHIETALLFFDKNNNKQQWHKSLVRYLETKRFGNEVWTDGEGDISSEDMSLLEATGKKMLGKAARYILANHCLVNIEGYDWRDSGWNGICK